MRLGEAIRLGAMLKPQAYHSPRLKWWSDGSCALAAACDAVGVSYFSEEMGSMWPHLYKVEQMRCPHCGGLEYNLFAVAAIHLNDRHHWTREAIADWVDSVDPTPRTEPITEAVVQEPTEMRQESNQQNQVGVGFQR